MSFLWVTKAQLADIAFLILIEFVYLFHIVEVCRFIEDNYTGVQNISMYITLLVALSTSELMAMLRSHIWCRPDRDFPNQQPLCNSILTIWV